MSRHINIAAFGTYFRSYREAASFFGIPESTIRYRSSKHMDAEVALICTDAVSLRFIGLNGRAYYKVAGKDGYFTARQIVEHYRPDLLADYDKYYPDGKCSPFWISRGYLEGGGVFD